MYPPGTLGTVPVVMKTLGGDLLASTQLFYLVEGEKH